MRIVHLVAGAGNMYCGSCMVANTLVTALCDAGEDALLVPLYTPLRLDEDDVSVRHIAFGGVNIYLQERLSWFRHAPRFLTKLLDHPRLLRWAGRRAGSTRPEGLGPLTVSMLRGEAGWHRGEIDRLTEWLRDDLRPDVVHLSNVMLAGVARALGERLGVPVVASLTGEDAFLERIPEPHYAEARAALAAQAGELTALVAMNRYYAGFMAEYLSVPRERIHVVPPGVNLAGHSLRQRDDPSGQPVTIGFLARICPEKGLHLLAAAFRLLAADESLPPLRVVAAGHLAAAERPYLRRIEKQIAAWGLADQFEYVGEPDRAEKIALLQSFDVMCLPTIYRESKGLPVLEAWANGVPVVVPNHGTFPELIADTGAGLLFTPGDATSLAAALRQFVTDPATAADHGRRGREAIEHRYHAGAMAQRMIDVYRGLV